MYYIRGNLSISADYNRANVRDASTVVLMADRDNLAQVDDEDLDAVTLFTYLKLTGHIPSTVFFTAELTFESNMVVLNRHIMQHRLDRERDDKHNVQNKSFLTVKGRISGFSDYAVVESTESPPILGSSHGRQQSFMHSFSKSMKEGVMSVRSGGMGALLRPSGKDSKDNSVSEDPNGRYAGMDNSQTSVKEKSKSWSISSQKRGNHQSTVVAVESVDAVSNEMSSHVHRLHTIKSSSGNSAHSSARNTPRQHSAMNPLLRQASTMLHQLPEGMSPRTPRSTTNNVEAEIGPVVEVHELPVFASGRAFVPGMYTYIHTYIHTA